MAKEEGGAKASRISVRISDDEMEAFILVLPPPDGEAYKEDQLFQAIFGAGIIYGMKKGEVKSILQSGKYGEEICIASGQKAVNGIDGYFEYLFDTKVDDRPRILKDGSVDYTTYGNMQIVEEGQELAVYHPAQKGKDGVNVRGASIVAKPGRDLARLKGRNTSITEDGKYVAAVAGKIVYDANTPSLSILEVLEVSEDVSVNTGDIIFKGDIHVMGNIQSDMTVRSEKGGIIVDGHVEGAKLIAKKDIVLKNGMQGNGKGMITCKGSVSGKFFEQAVVEADGSVNANSILHCEINAGEDIIVSGRLGIIVGGQISALRRIEATMIGNMAEVKTRITAGIEGDLFSMLTNTEQQIKELEREVGKLLDGIKRADEILKAGLAPDKANQVQMKKMEILRAKVERDAKVTELIKEKESLLVKMEKANQAKVVIQKGIFPGAEITINGMTTKVKEQYNHVEYSRRSAGIIVNNIGE